MGAAKVGGPSWKPFILGGAICGFLIGVFLEWNPFGWENVGVAFLIYYILFMVPDVIWDLLGSAFDSPLAGLPSMLALFAIEGSICGGGLYLVVRLIYSAVATKKRPPRCA